jgi:hypothetical protein
VIVGEPPGVALTTGVDVGAAVWIGVGDGVGDGVANAATPLTLKPPTAATLSVTVDGLKWTSMFPVWMSTLKTSKRLRSAVQKEVPSGSRDIANNEVSALPPEPVNV